MREPDRRIEDWLTDIVEWGEKLARHIAGMSEDDFRRDEKTTNAAAKCIEAVGEAANRILQEEPDIQARRPGLALREAYRARNRLSHGYFDINHDIIWRTATGSIPALVREARIALAQIESEKDRDA